MSLTEIVLKLKIISILIKTAIVVLAPLAIFNAVSRVLPKVLNHYHIYLSQEVYSILILLVNILVIFICLKLIYNENKSLSFEKTLKRLRFKKITRKGTYAILAIYLLSGILGACIKLFLEYLKVPFNIAERLEITQNSGLKENPILLILSILLILIIGPLEEEILFRGYLLPKQEVVLGKFAWVLNGFAFTLAHFLVYDIPSLLIFSPFPFLVAYMVQKHQNTSIGLIAHMLVNTGFIIRLFVEIP